MKAFHSLRRLLAQRLDRLHDSLTTLRDRLHETVVRLVGDGVGDAVRDMVQAVLVTSPNTGPPVFPIERVCRPRSPVWGEPNDHLDDEMRADDLFDDDLRDGRRFDARRPRHDRHDRLDADDDEYALEPAVVPSAATPSLVDAVVVGSRAVAWWSRRRPDRPGWAALGIGVLVGLATFGSGLLPGLVGTAMTVTGLLS